MYGGTFGKSGAVGGVDTEVMSEVLSMYCLAYRIVNGKLLTTGSDFNIGSDLNSTIWPSVAKRCWVPSNTFSFKKPKQTYLSNFIGCSNFLKAIKKYKKSCKFLNASSSEIYAKSIKKININSKKKPISPYGKAKLLSFNLTKKFRKKY